MPTDFLSYWKPATEKQQPSGPLGHSASAQFGSVNKGDTVWIVTARKGGKLTLAFEGNRVDAIAAPDA